MEKNQAVIMKSSDNVATAISHIEAGSTVTLAVDGVKLHIQISQLISFGHKFAIAPLKKGDAVIKYGETIGAATKDILAGQHVHVHNVESIRGRGDKP